jgi:hypothetical protein
MTKEQRRMKRSVLAALHKAELDRRESALEDAALLVMRTCAHACGPSGSVALSAFEKRTLGRVSRALQIVGVKPSRARSLR